MTQLPVQIGASAALVFVPWVVARGYARYVETTDDPVEDRLHRLRRMGQLLGFVVPIAAVAAGFGLGLVETYEAALLGVMPLSGSVVELFVVLVVFFLLIGLPVATIELGLYPVKRSLRETTASRWHVLKETLTGFAFVALPIVVVIASISAATSYFGSSLPVLVAALVVAVGAVFLLSPYLLLVTNDRIPLTGEKRTRVESLCAELDYQPRELYLIEGTEMKTANAIVAGTLPGFQYVFLTDYLVSECSDEQLQAILAHEVGHVEHRHIWQQFALTVGFFGAAFAVDTLFGIMAFLSQLGGIVTAAAFMTLMFLYYPVVLGVVSLSHEFQADRYAAKHAGVTQIVAALDVLAEANDMRREASRFYSVLTMHPPISDRIEAVRAIESSSSESVPAASESGS